GFPDASVVGFDFTPPKGRAFDLLLAHARGAGRNPHADLSCPLLIVYTSGTTGRPKGAVLRQEALLWNGVMSQHMHALTSDDHVLTVLPFFHVGGLNIQTTPALHHGATVTIHPRFIPAVALATIERNRPPLTVLLPSIIQAVIDDSGVELPPDTPGEIVVRGPNVFSEYWGNEAATREALHDGWYRTGDIGRRDADGYFWVHDRKKNLIISGGENIYPAEVERVLLEHPDVVECGVIGRSDPKWDEVPVAYVIRRAGCLIGAEDLKAHVLTQLARFKVPRDIVFVDDLPRTALGKVQHFMLRKLYESTPAPGGAL